MEINKEYLWDYELGSIDVGSDSFKKWYIARILMKGNLSDIKSIGLEEIKKYFTEMTLPLQIREFWEWYLNKKYPGNHEHTDKKSEISFKHNIKSPFIKR